MWFDDPYKWWLPISGLPLLATCCVALAGALHVWVLAASAPCWLRFGTMAAVVVLLVQLEAPELVLFVLGHLTGVLIVRAVAGVLHLRGIRTVVAARRWDLIGVMVVLAAESAFALSRSDVIDPGRWLSMGIGVGCAAAIIDVGMTCRRWWFPLSVTMAAIAIAVAGVTAGLAVRGDLFGIGIKYDDDEIDIGNKGLFSFGVLAWGTMLYGFWRLAGRLALAPGRNEDQPRNWRLGALFPLRGDRSWWASLGSGFGRVSRLIVVWPTLVALSVVIFTPWMEAWWHLPSTPETPPQPAADPAYATLIAFPDRLDWSLAPSRKLDDNTLAVIGPFFDANREAILQLRNILSRPCRPTLDYHPLTRRIAEKEIKSIHATMTALFMIHLQAIRSLDSEMQYNTARLMLLLARPFRRPGLLIRHSVLGRGVEIEGFAMACRARTKLDPEQCSSLMALVRESAAMEEDELAVERRDTDWEQIVRGWRDRVERACYPAWLFEFFYVVKFEQEHEAYRRTLICDLALRQYEYDHEVESPERLEQLVPRYLSEIPRDPYNGEPLRYEQTRAVHPLTFTYSIGPNKKSDCGEPDGLFSEGDDISITRFAFDWLGRGVGHSMVLPADPLRADEEADTPFDVQEESHEALEPDMAESAWDDDAEAASEQPPPCSVSDPMLR